MEERGLIRTEIANLIRSIEPYDALEKQHQEETLGWIQSTASIFRIQKPDVPNKHLVSYFCLFDFEVRKALLVEHKKAGLWLPSGGHVEVDEHPMLTVERECLEELGIHAEFWKKEPIFITSTMTVGATAGHTDVSLWYLLKGHTSTHYEFDPEEFASIQWFSFDDIPFEVADPHMRRFIGKVQSLL